MRYRSSLNERKAVNDIAAISVEAKIRLAKLLAQENITVEHSSKYTTASFDTKNRVLRLPVWEGMTKHLYDLFVGHEVGHGLYTPDKNWAKYGRGLFSFINILEDARIEKMMKRKFPGLVKSMRFGYDELANDRKFFGDLSRVSEYMLIDRINIAAKCGTAVDVPFTEEERKTFDRVMNTRTFEDVEALARELFEQEKQRSATDTHQQPEGEEGEESEEAGESGEGSSGSGESDDNEANETSGDGDSESSESSESADGSKSGESGDSSDSADGSADDSDSDESGESGAGSSDEDGDESESDSKSGNGDADSDPCDSGAAGDESGDESENSSAPPAAPGQEGGAGGSSSIDSDPVAITDEMFRKMEEEMAAQMSGSLDIHYTDMPKMDTISPKDFVLPSKHVAPVVVADWLSSNASQTSEAEITKFMKEANERAKPAVALLLKEFEMKKAAEAARRAMEAQTGVIDTNKLHSHKWDDNIFRKNTFVPDGKSHGLQMFIDWSGSMHSNLTGAIDQLYSLILFCDRAGIPYDVYAFSNNALRNAYNFGHTPEGKAAQQYVRGMKGAGEFVPGGRGQGGFHLLHFASSRDSKALKTLSRKMLAIIREAYRGGSGSWDYRSKCKYGSHNLVGLVDLSGTPLNEATIAASRLVRDFQSETGVQIVNAVFVTDGAGHGLAPYLGGGQPWVIRDPETGRDYKAKGGDSETAAFNAMLRDRTGANVVNFFVNSRSDVNTLDYVLLGLVTDAGIRRNRKDLRNRFPKEYKAFKEEGGFLLNREDTVLGYDHNYVMSAEIIEDEDKTLTVNSNATAAAAKKAFIKSRKGSLRARKVLSEFVTMIA